jgi:hypothetical protein
MIKMYLALSFVTVSLLFSILGHGSSCRSEGAKMSNAPVVKNDDNKLAAGVWGGQHIRMQVTDGGAQIEYDCAHSTIDQAIVLDRQGRFDVKGKFTREHGGPVRDNEAPNSSPVRYAGQVEDQTLTLTITHDETGESLGSYTLTQGSVGRVMKCR